MTALTLPFIEKHHNPALTFFCLAVVGAGIVFTVYMLCRHAHGHHKARKEGVDRRHDGSHGNH